MSPIAGNRSMLIGSDKEEGAGDDDEIDPETISTGGQTALTNMQIVVYSVLAFGVSAVLPPGLFTAALRYAILAAGVVRMPELLEELQSTPIENVIQINALPAVAHWKGRLYINVVDDYATYPLIDKHIPPPFHVYWNKDRGGLAHQHYKVHSTDAGNRYPVHAEVDDFSLLQKNLR